MSKEKQIEDFENDLRECHTEFSVSDDSMDIYTDYKITAQNMIGKGWSKQSEGEWIIKSEIYKLIDDVDEELFVECSICQRRFNVPYELDDEKIFKYAREHYPYCNCGAKMKGGAK